MFSKPKVSNFKLQNNLVAIQAIICPSVLSVSKANVLKSNSLNVVYADVTSDRNSDIKNVFVNETPIIGHPEVLTVEAVYPVVRGRIKVLISNGLEYDLVLPQGS